MNLEPDKNQDFLFVKDELFRDVEEYAQDEGFKHVQELFQNLDDMDEDLFQDFNDTDNVFMPYSPEFFEYHHCNSSILTFAEHYNFGFEEAFRSGFEKAFQDFNNNVQPPEYYDFIFEKYCCQVHKNSLQDFNNTDEITENSTVELSVLVEKTLQNSYFTKENCYNFTKIFIFTLLKSIVITLEIIGNFFIFIGKLCLSLSNYIRRYSNKDKKQ